MERALARDLSLRNGNGTKEWEIFLSLGRSLLWHRQDCDPMSHAGWSGSERDLARNLARVLARPDYNILTEKTQCKYRRPSIVYANWLNIYIFVYVYTHKIISKELSLDSNNKSFLW